MPVPRISGDYGSSTYGSGKSGHYRNITVRESIASLRARNALPTFLSENRRPPTEAVTLRLLISLLPLRVLFFIPSLLCSSRRKQTTRESTGTPEREMRVMRQLRVPPLTRMSLRRWQRMSVAMLMWKFQVVNVT